MTAEGDNSVLMQKVSKELLAAIQAKKVVYPKIDSAGILDWDVTKIETLVKLVKLREIHLAKEVCYSFVFVLIFVFSYDPRRKRLTEHP